jgi:hypothetical protein
LCALTFASLYQQEYIINNANISVLVVGGPRAHRSDDDEGDDDSRFEVLHEMLELSASCPSLKLIISMEDPTTDHLERAKSLVQST